MTPTPRSATSVASILLCATFTSVVSREGASAQTTETATQERRDLTLEEIYSADDDVRLDWNGSVPSITWLDDEHWLERRDAEGPEADAEAEARRGRGRNRDNEAEAERRETAAHGHGSSERKVLMKVHARTGRAEPYFDHGKLTQSLAKLPGMDAATAEKLVHGTLQRNASHEHALVDHAKDLFYFDLTNAEAKRLTFDPAEEVGAEFSPDAKFVSFIRHYNLHLLDVASGDERALTDGGGPDLFFGRLDWVYQEEIYGRGNFKGYWWSPDSSHLAYLKLDESPVREFTVVDHIPTELETEVTNYPKAGSPNPKVSLGVVSALGGDTVWLDTSKYASIEHLIVRVGWTPDSEQVVFQVQDREQRWLDLNVADPVTGKVTTVLREGNVWNGEPVFVQVLGEPEWLSDGGFLWLSERTGFQHVYRYAKSDDAGSGFELAGAVTSGEWEVRGFDGVDEEANGGAGLVFFEGMQHDPIAPHVYSVGLDGTGLTRLSEGEGSHSASWSTGHSLYYDRWSSVQMPTRAELFAADGERVRVVEANEMPHLEEFRWGAVERFQVPTEDGFLMEAMLIKPPDFDPSKTYPVLQYNYGGPHAPVVRDAWGGQRYAWHQMLAQRGWLIWMCDNRSASGKGIRPTWEAYGRMGVLELADIEDGLDWLVAKPWVDAERVGIWGWSYGGFMAAFALTHSERFAFGVAGAPVTDWRLYDTVYTERYMRMPQNNADGYDATSVVKAASDLSGELLIVHGTMDDNVHLQNSVQLIYELQKAGKEFEMMIYPKSRHGVRERGLVWHLWRGVTGFLEGM